MVAHYTIQTFSKEWWVATSFTLIIIALILWLGLSLRISYRDRLTKMIGIILIGRFFLIHPYQHYILDIWSVKSSLPFHLCGISAILSGVLLLWKSQFFYECLFYWGLCGAFHSILTPEMTNGSQGLLYFEYYLSHGGIILSALYLTYVIGMRPRVNSWFRVFIFSQILIPVIGCINMLLDSNYLYLSYPPEVNNPIIDFIREQPKLIYIIFIDIVALVHFYLIYVLMNIKIFKNEKNFV
tara:strand:- start:332 stop:1051 length:720 start_codon:yes stop_codon:yes gene_type:complete